MSKAHTKLTDRQARMRLHIFFGLARVQIISQKSIKLFLFHLPDIGTCYGDFGCDLKMVLNLQQHLTYWLVSVRDVWFSGH